MPKSITYSVQMSLAGALVAAIILIDIATGQGPPALNSYMGQQTVPGALPYGAGLPPAQTMGYLQGPPMHYENLKEREKEYEKEHKIEEKEQKSLFHPFGGAHEKAKLEKEKEKDYGYYKQYEDKSTPAPGVFSSLSNGMSGAWKSITGFGRQRRSLKEESDASPASDNKATVEVSDEHLVTGSSMDQGHQSSGRSIEDWELRQYNNQGYVFFKVPKNLICYNQY